MPWSANRPRALLRLCSIGLAGLLASAVCAALIDVAVTDFVPTWPIRITALLSDLSSLGDPTGLLMVLFIMVVLGVILNRLAGGNRGAPLVSLLPTMLVACGFATLLSVLIKRAVGRARPFLADGHLHFVPFSALPAMDSFPSSQAAFFGALAAVCWLRWPRLAPVWLSLVTLSASLRVLTGVHWPSDVIAGLTLGVVTTLAIGRAFPPGNPLITTPGPDVRRPAKQGDFS